MPLNLFNNSKIRLSLREQMVLIKRLSFLIKSGTPLQESILILKEEQKSGKLKVALENIGNKISHGQPLSTSLSTSLGSFSDFGISVIRIGETTGTLDESLEYLSQELKKRDALKRKLIGASVYPVVVCLSAFAITLFLILYLFPKIIPVFKSLNLDLPITTTLLISISIFLKSYWFWLVLFIFLFLIVFSLSVSNSQKAKYFWHKVLLNIPVIKQITRKYILTNDTRALALLLRSGINLEEALIITSGTSTNLVYRERFMETSKIVSSGQEMSSYMKKFPLLFPETATSLISAGEKSGNLEHSLTCLSELFEQEVDDFSKNISNLIEPVLMVLMGLIVGFIAFSIITPIYDITQNLKPN